MLAMDQIHDIRNDYYVQGLNISEIANKRKLDWKTVQKYVDMTDFNNPAPMPKEKALCPKLEPYKAKIDEWLIADKAEPRKQRHTAARVYKRLKDEVPGFCCSERTVSTYVAARKKELGLKKPEGFIPLIHSPGEAQADFGSADYVEDGVRRSGKYFVLDFPYSNAGFLQLQPGENLECLLESMVGIFEHIGGVPTEIWFDNASSMVSTIIRGGGRELTERFVRFSEHYGFQPVFMNPASGNEKGGVENKVGYSRHNMLVPTPRFLSLREYNQELLKLCDKDANREHYRFEGETIEDRFQRDSKVLRRLPDKPFDTARYEQVTTDKWGKFTLNAGKHIYSAAPELAQQEVWLKITAGFVTVMDSHQQDITTHRRLYGDEVQESMQWLPYLKAISRKPRSLRNSGIYGMLPENMRVYLDGCQNTERGKILQMLCELTERTGFDSAVQTVDQAILYKANDPDSLKALHRRLFSDLPELPPLEQTESMPNVIQFPTDLSAYDKLLGKVVTA